MSEQTTVSRDALENGINDSWIAGYEAAIRSLHELGDDVADDGVKRIIAAIASMLEATKP